MHAKVCSRINKSCALHTVSFEKILQILTQHMSSKEISVHAICQFSLYTLYVHLSGGKWSTLLLHWPPVKKLTLLVLSRPLVRGRSLLTNRWGWKRRESFRGIHRVALTTKRSPKNFIAPDPVQIVRNETNCPFRTHRTVAIQEALSKLPPPLPRADCILFQHYEPPINSTECIHFHNGSTSRALWIFSKRLNVKSRWRRG